MRTHTNRTNINIKKLLKESLSIWVGWDAWNQAKKKEKKDYSPAFSTALKCTTE